MTTDVTVWERDRERLTVPRRRARCMTSRCLTGHQHSPIRDFCDDDEDEVRAARPADDSELVLN